MPYQWIDPQPVSINEEIRERFAHTILLAEMLSRRGIATKEDADVFLDPALYTSPSPMQFPDMEKGVSRLNSAILNQEVIGIWGDFDADGQTATALLKSALEKLGGTVHYRVPVRAQESHGIQAAVLDKYLEKNHIQLLITCDTGISEMEALQLAARKGCDVIVTDHHTPPDVLPPAHAIINPKLLSPDHAFYHLAGVGTAYQVIRSLFASRNEKDISQEFLDLVALGTIADLAELNPENRFLVQKGLACMNSSLRPALQALMVMAGMNGQPIDEGVIGYVIAPRLNAAGRLGDANIVVEYLLSEDPGLIETISRELEDLNFQRKMYVDAVVDAALKKLQTDRHLLDYPVIVLSMENWEKGVIGIAASQIVEEFQKPVILLSESGGMASGSARSIEGVNIIEAIRQNGHLLHTYGGHPMAAGLSMDGKNIETFRIAIAKSVAAMVEELPGKKELHIDAIIPLSGVTYNLASEINRLSPFGHGNPAPILVSRDLHVLSSTTIGKKGEHLKIRIKDSEGAMREAIWWRGAGKSMPKGDEDQFDLAYTIQPSFRNGQDAPQVEWVDFQIASREIIEVKRVHRDIKITDLRSIMRDADQDLPLNEDGGVQVWGENLQIHHQIPLLNRFQVRKGDALVILTAPPSQPTLFEMIHLVMPGKITFMDLPGSNDTLVDFSKMLMGLVKYGFNHKDGCIDIHEIACAMCQTETTIRAGMDWLVSLGKLSILNRENNVLKLSITDLPASTTESAARKKLLKMLEETAAYRSYYKRCGTSQLLPPA